MKTTNQLISISEILKAPLDIFSNDNTDYSALLSSIDSQHRVLIALYRIESTINPYLRQQFLGFLEYFSQIILSRHSTSFYDNLIRFLKKEYTTSPFQLLYGYLARQGYTKTSILNMTFTQEENELIKSFPKNKKWLAVLMFYFYDPVSIQVFFDKFIWVE